MWRLKLPLLPVRSSPEIGSVRAARLAKLAIAGSRLRYPEMRQPSAAPIWRMSGIRTLETLFAPAELIA
jgi:hypothetical protein